jgi:hypothetical protein
MRQFGEDRRRVVFTGAAMMHVLYCLVENTTSNPANNFSTKRLEQLGWFYDGIGDGRAFRGIHSVYLDGLVQLHRRRDFVHREPRGCHRRCISGFDDQQREMQVFWRTPITLSNSSGYARRSFR